MLLKECENFKWYDVVDGCGRLKDGSTIMYINKTDHGLHHIVVESLVDEIGSMIDEDFAERISVEPLKLTL